MDRRRFLKHSALGGGLLLVGGFPFEALAGVKEKRLTILHTNDVHSRLEPFAEGGRFAGMGGVVARAALIKKIRAEGNPVLLVDAGDIFQGTTYFTMHKGEPDIKAMSMMGYDACTMGKHDFDAGVDGFARQLPHANFPVLTANYDFAHTALENRTQPYAIIQKGTMLIGLVSVGVALEGLVHADAYGNTKYLDPIPVVNRWASYLKKEKNCDLVICLSHLGYAYESNQVSDCVLAAETEHVDIIIGGHTHTFLDKPVTVNNKNGVPVIINQVGWGGVKLGRIDLVLGSKKEAKISNAQSVIVSKQTRGE